MSQAFEVVQPQNPTTTTTLIEFILDETGSMNPVRNQTIDSFNEYVGSQRVQPGECLLTLTKFDDRGIRTQYTDTNVKDVPLLDTNSYMPTGMTNLYDAVGVRISALTQRSVQYQHASKLIVIMTDGHDNCSSEYSAASLKELIKSKESEGWTFVFLGANQDAWQVGQTFGMAKGNTMTYSTSDMKGAMADLASATTLYRGVRASGAVNAMAASNDFFDSIKKSGDPQ